MNKLDEQLRLVRAIQRNKYLQNIANNEEIIKKQHERKIQDERIIKQIDHMSLLAQKYQYIFNPTATQRAATTIVRFVKKHWFSPVCLNDNECQEIPGIYKFRLHITNHHIYEYSEKDVNASILDMHRKIYKMNLPSQKIISFVYCFDVRKLYQIRHELIEIYGEFYFLQPDDHKRLINAWNKINDNTAGSQIFLNNLRFDKSAIADRRKTYLREASINELNRFRQHIKTTLDEQDKFNNLFDDKYLENLHREYFNKS